MASRRDVIVHLDTSVLVSSFTGPRALLPAVKDAIRGGHRLVTSAPVLYEWLRGPRLDDDLELQRELCPPDALVAFNTAEATLAANLYRAVNRARGREMDVAIAACALEHGAALWTVNPRDFKDIPGLMLYEGRR
jgi:predicted nucleic acid-binding protein